MGLFLFLINLGLFFLFYLNFEFVIQGTITTNLIISDHGYLNGDPLEHIRPEEGASDFDRDMIRFNLINVGNDIVIIQNVATLDYLECGNVPFRENKVGTDKNPNWVRWELVPFGEGYLIRCVENGWMLDAGWYHLRPANDTSDPSYITWNILHSV
jgi:hypothetical protein